MDWNTLFENYKKCKFADIKKYLTEEVNEETKAYKAIVKAQVANRESYLNIKKAFYAKFFPQYIPVKHKGMESDVEDW